MKKIKNIILLISIIFLLSGCSGTYNLTIDNEGIREGTSITETSETVYKAAYQYKMNTLDGYYESYSYLNDYTKYVKNNIVDTYYINKDNFDKDNFINSNGVSNNNYIYSIYNSKKTFNNKNNFLINNVIKDSLIINDNNIILYIDELPTVITSNLDSFRVTIKVEDLEVVSNNADSVEDNSYVWNFTKNNYYNKTLSLNIKRPVSEDNTKDNSNNNNNSNNKETSATSILIVIGIYLVVIIVVINALKKKNKIQF